MAASIPFGVMPDGTIVEQYTLRSGALSCDIITFGGSLLTVRSPTSGASNSHGVTGGVYKARERIHRDILIRDY